jgi:cytochrome c oxidase subunit 2
MFEGFPLFPPQASTVAGRVDALYFFLIGISTFFSLLIGTLLVVFVVRFRRRRAGELPRPIHGSLVLELTWTVIPLTIALGTFVWSADVFVSSRRVPPGAMEVYVVGKRWMWKTQHVTGQREINELHVPVGVPVKLTMTSEDVIHSFFIPAFRTKQDVIPGRYTTIWFQATKTGEFHLFCAEYCGTKHSQMIGSIHVMEPGAFQTWLAGGAAGSPAQEGEKLFQSFACITCHRADSQGRGPRLEGLFGRTVRLQNGQTLVADADYIRESILNPTAKVVEGYQPIMPTFQGLVTEESVMQLIAYIQSLQAPGAEVVAPPAAGGVKLLEGAGGVPASGGRGGAASPAPRNP